MSKYMFCCPHLKYVSSERLIHLLLSEPYRMLLLEYRSTLQDDPDYLRFHCTSAALRLQFELKLHDVPDLSIGACDSSGCDECCIIDALEEAIRRLDVAAASVSAA